MIDNELLKVIYNDMQQIKQDMQEVKQRITSLELTVENVTNRNINIIAEGHKDVIRKLDDALKVENEKELLLIRLNILENEVRKLKEQVNEIA